VLRVQRKVRRECGVREGRVDRAGPQRQHEGREAGDCQVDRQEDPQHAHRRRPLQRHRRASPFIYHCAHISSELGASRFAVAATKRNKVDSAVLEKTRACDSSTKRVLDVRSL